MEFRAVHVTDDDVRLLRKISPANNYPTNEDFAKDLYLNELIIKPWGHEYRIYIDNLYDVWKLAIKPGQQTSTHCHPRKDTILLCLAGTGRLVSSNGEQIVQRGEYVHIKKGVFHSTENIGGINLDLIEVEIPRNKFDLVRSADHYGRAAKEYEIEGLSDHTLQALRPIEFGKPAQLRERDLLGEYSFTVSKYANVKDTPHVICHINVDIGPYLQDRISIYKTVDQMPHAEKEHGSFLTIASTKNSQSNYLI